MADSNIEIRKPLPKDYKGVEEIGEYSVDPIAPVYKIKQGGFGRGWGQGFNRFGDHIFNADAFERIFNNIYSRLYSSLYARSTTSSPPQPQLPTALNQAIATRGGTQTNPNNRYIGRDNGFELGTSLNLSIGQMTIDGARITTQGGGIRRLRVSYDNPGSPITIRMTFTESGTTNTFSTEISIPGSTNPTFADVRLDVATYQDAFVVFGGNPIDRNQTIDLTIQEV